MLSSLLVLGEQMLNDVSFKKFAVISLSLFLAFNGSIALDHLNLGVPLTRQVFGFLFLTFIPGYTILRILRVHKIDGVEALLYAVGLSLFYIMLIGVAINLTYPIIGIKEPIMLKQLLTTFNATYLLLLGLAYIKDKHHWISKSTNGVEFKDVLTPQVLILMLLPILAIWGAKIVNITGNSSLLIFMLFLIALTPVSILLKGKKTYLTWTIWILTISLLYGSDFGTSWYYIWGYDINWEYYLSHLTLTNKIWSGTNPSIVGISEGGALNVNTALSVVILNPFYSILLSLSPVIIFKMFYPFIFSLVPVALYKAYNHFLEKIESFLAVFFFISFSTFFVEMLSLARQQIAELYLALIILLIFTKKLNRTTKKTFLFIFGFGLIISHYGTTWLFLISLTGGWAIYSFLYIGEQKKFLLRKIYIGIFITTAITYYIVVSNSSVFNTVVFVGNLILSSIHEMFTPKAQAFYLVTKQVSDLHKLGKYVYLTTQGLIGIGILWLLFNYKKTNVNREFAALTFVWFAYEIASIAVPYFSNALGVSRVFHLTLFFLAPFEVIGGIAVFKFLQGLVKVQLSKSTILRVLSVFLAVYLLFTSNVIYKIANDPPYYGYLGKEVSVPRWTDSEIVSGLWIEGHRDNNPVYADEHRVLLFLGLLGQPIKSHMLLINPEGDIVQPKGILEYYLFLGSWNIKNKRLNVRVSSLDRGERIELPIETLEIFNMLLQSNKIYSSQNAQYYLYGNSLR